MGLGLVDWGWSAAVKLPELCKSKKRNVQSTPPETMGFFYFCLNEVAMFNRHYLSILIAASALSGQAFALLMSSRDMPFIPSSAASSPAGSHAGFLSESDQPKSAACGGLSRFGDGFNKLG